MAQPTLFEVVTQAINDVSAHGFDSAERIAYWQQRIKMAAERQMMPPQDVAELLKGSLEATYKRLIDQYGVLKQHPGVSRFTVDKLRPQLRGELQRRIMASADLIKLNREQAMAKTLQRFSGWALSIPAGGSDVVDKRDEKAHVRKAITQLPYEARRVAIDQGHKLAASINETIARGSGAIAVEWHSRWKQPGYDFREDHKERDKLIYLLRNSWAYEQGLVKPGDAGFYEDVTAVGEEISCRCSGQWFTSLRALPQDMITAKGKAEQERVRAEIKRMTA